ncbi:uncharacterized protein LOC131206954 [Anopheles bellator]|uniref:uncharacterized protein LOC131206954 n=1 Tax=Anopheles bellator TaxID=139047 RepID=UPI0026490D62|nr:uncharacterized protein LOC131206954 [Anopheles bellator]
MDSKATLILLAFGLVCVLQVNPAQATNTHVRQLLQAFRKIDLDTTKKSFYIHNVKYGIQVHLREPLMKVAGAFPESAKLSDACLSRMVKEVDEIELTFYAKFSYHCVDHPQYSVACMEAAQPEYNTSLMELATKTKSCLRQ